jgi:mono/diheme cytochrome c family protein
VNLQRSSDPRTHRRLRWVIKTIAALFLIVLGLTGWVYVASESHFRSFELPAPFAHDVPTDPASLARGEHLVRTRGCSGCHGEDLAGRLMWGSAVAPNLAEYARTESAASFEAAVRHGIGRDGRALYAMPSYNFVHLRDADVADLIAYLRAAPVAQKTLPEASLPWLIRLAIALGKDAAMPAYLDRVPPLRRAEDPDVRIARGEYIAMTTCNECHGFGLRADVPWEGGAAPDLIIMAAYEEPAFRRLMREGIAIGDRELQMMSPVARGRFAHFTDQELEDLYAFLSDMSARAAGGDESPGAAR